MRSGYGRSIFEPLLPLILGRDVSGEVAAIGASVSSLVVGQEVFGALHPTAVRGTYADYVVLSEDELTPKPPSVTHVFIFSLLLLLTLYFCSQRLLVLGGGGAVGLAAIQLGVAVGCSVSATCGSQSIERVLAVGAEQAIDYTAEVNAVAIKGQFDAVIDTIGVPETERTGINLLKKGGHYMTLQVNANSHYRMSFCRIAIVKAADAEGLHEIRRLSGAGKLKIPVEKTFSIAEVRKAHEMKEKRIIPGKPRISKRLQQRTVPTPNEHHRGATAAVGGPRRRLRPPPTFPPPRRRPRRGPRTPRVSPRPFAPLSVYHHRVLGHHPPHDPLTGVARGRGGGRSIETATWTRRPPLAGEQRSRG
ncbi:hypothetical protein B296_00031635 [Ensete ventricosum]|uniref:Enoyl reductase (ER) domain-containing protein n=1 Tax=Ensete ventricosum TaxID=4639 RepID=A0A426XHM1_ENSVE|nr:hypothetical protein B296_00031635 [Ensete ventricosum]